VSDEVFLDDRTAVLAATPGTSRTISQRSCVPLYRVRRQLKALRSEDVVIRKPRWLGQFAYTWVYERAGPGAPRCRGHEEKP